LTDYRALFDRIQGSFVSVKNVTVILDLSRSLVRRTQGFFDGVQGFFDRSQGSVECVKNGTFSPDLFRSLYIGYRALLTDYTALLIMSGVSSLLSILAALF